LRKSRSSLFLPYALCSLPINLADRPNT